MWESAKDYAKGVTKCPLPRNVTLVKPACDVFAFLPSWAPTRFEGLWINKDTTNPTKAASILATRRYVYTQWCTCDISARTRAATQTREPSERTHTRSTLCPNGHRMPSKLYELTASPTGWRKGPCRQRATGGSVLHLFSSRSLRSTSGENSSVMLNSRRTSSGVLSASVPCEHERGGVRLSP